MSTKIASLYAEIGADTSKFEQGTSKVKSGLDQQAAAFARFDAEATRNAKSFLSYEAQKQKALAATERADAKLVKQLETEAKAAAKAAEAERKASLSIAPGIEAKVAGMEEFTAANAGLIGVATAVVGAVAGIGVAMDKTIESVVAYGDEVVKLKTITGQSAEATSNTILLADKARVGYDQLTISLQHASKAGIDTSIDGLAKLSEEYKKLNPGIERTEFLVKTFGKSGVDMGKILELDTSEIKNFQGAAGNILTEKDLQNIKLYNASLLDFKEKLSGAANTAGKALIPIKTAILEAASGYTRALDLMINKHMSLSDALKQAVKEQNAEEKAFMSTSDATTAAADGIDNVGTALQKLNQTSLTGDQLLQGLSSSFTGLLSAMSTIQKANDDYTKSSNDLAKSDQQLADKKVQLTYEWYKQVQAGKDTTQAYTDYMKALTDVSTAEQDNADKKAQLQVDAQKAIQQRKYDMVEQKLAVDGISTKEFNYLENLKVNYGLVSRAAADQAIAENQAADQLVSGFESTLPPMEQSLKVMEQIAAFNGTMVNFGVNYQSNLPASAPAMNTQAGGNSGGGSANLNSYYTPGTDTNSNTADNSYWWSMDDGGSGIAGTPYMIGTGAQPELFVPKTDGNFYPNGKGMNGGAGGTNYNVTINNPVPAKSEDSIRTSLQKLSYLGKAA